jgi:FKBP-type peptidyl-prolyl cis-trans isomerase (trigger factor)
MFGIGHLLEKFKSIQAKEALYRQVVLDAVKKHTNIEVSPLDINKRSHEIILSKLSSEARSVIFMKKQHILKDINEHELLRHIRDIR